MMEKMGWCEGQGLGARKQGPLEPILPSIKQDMKGLASEGEKVSSLAQRLLSHLPDNTTRLPVTMLEEYCAGRQLAAPQYELMEEAGPPHKKLFVMRVKVNDIYYQPTVACMTKKEAKHLAAVVSLQAFGILPKDPPQVQLKMQFQQNDEKRSMS